MNLRTKKTLKILAIIIAIWGAMFTTDFVRATKNSPPIFCISFADYDVSSGYVGYTGFFYRVERNLVEVNGKEERQYKVLPWFH